MSKVISLRVTNLEYANYLIEAEEKSLNLSEFMHSKIKDYIEKKSMLEENINHLKTELDKKPKEVVKIKEVPKEVVKEVVKVDNEEIERLNHLLQQCEARNRRMKASYTKVEQKYNEAASKHNNVVTRLKEANAYIKKNRGLFDKEQQF